MMYRLLHFLLAPMRTPRMLPIALRVIVWWSRVKTNTRTLLHWFVLRRWGLGVFHVDKRGTVYLRKDNGAITRVRPKDKK